MASNHWLRIVFIVVVTATGVHCDSELQAEIGMRPKRRPSEADHRVTIDLSALRPSLPGLVLYKYGDLAPKLVQVDLSALNPHLQPHVIWPQFSEMDLDDRSFDFEQGDAIPYLTDEESFMSPRQHQRMAKMTSWLDPSQNDIYDFVPDSVPKDKLLSLHESLPLADEVIVPLDWEEDGKSKDNKRNVFLTRGWRPGGDKANPHTVLPKARKGFGTNFNSYYTRASTNGITGKGVAQNRETESEDTNRKTGSSKTRTKDTWGPNALPLTSSRGRTNEGHSPRIPSQESWSVPRKYWNVPHLFVNNW